MNNTQSSKKRKLDSTIDDTQETSPPLKKQKKDSIEDEWANILSLKSDNTEGTKQKMDTEGTTQSPSTQPMTATQTEVAKSEGNTQVPSLQPMTATQTEVAKIKTTVNDTKTISTEDKLSMLKLSMPRTANTNTVNTNTVNTTTDITNANTKTSINTNETIKTSSSSNNNTVIENEMITTPSSTVISTNNEVSTSNDKTETETETETETTETETETGTGTMTNNDSSHVDWKSAYTKLLKQLKEVHKKDAQESNDNEQRYKVLKEINNNLSNEIKVLKKEKQNFESKLKAAKSDTDAQKTAFENMQEQIAEMNIKNEKLNAKLKENAKNAMNYRSQRDIARGQTQLWEKENGKLKKSIEKSAMTYNETKQKNERLELVHKGLNAEITKLKNENKKLTEENDILQSKNKDLSDQKSQSISSETEKPITKSTEIITIKSLSAKPEIIAIKSVSAIGAYTPLTKEELIEKFPAMDKNIITKEYEPLTSSSPKACMIGTLGNSNDINKHGYAHFDDAKSDDPSIASEYDVFWQLFTPAHYGGHKTISKHLNYVNDFTECVLMATKNTIPKVYGTGKSYEKDAVWMEESVSQSISDLVYRTIGFMANKLQLIIVNLKDRDSTMKDINSCAFSLSQFGDNSRGIFVCPSALGISAGLWTEKGSMTALNLSNKERQFYVFDHMHRVSLKMKRTAEDCKNVMGLFLVEVPLDICEESGVHSMKDELIATNDIFFAKIFAKDATGNQDSFMDISDKVKKEKLQNKKKYSNNYNNNYQNWGNNPYNRRRRDDGGDGGYYC